ncbi:MAG: MFS transporter [Planctomycetota bacterium]|nr:MFS transporter [Planctomycetota bacterium]
MGIVRRGLEGLVLLVAIQYFQAGEYHKAWLAAATSIGQLLSLPMIYGVSRLRVPVSRVMSVLFALGAVGLACAAALDNFHAYFFGILIGVPMISMSAPLVTSLWRQNVPDIQRGFLFSSVSERGSLGGLLASIVLAVWIGDDLYKYRAAFGVLAVALAFSSYCALRIPSQPLDKPRRNPFGSLAWLWKDPRFGYCCAAWMVMGLSNLSIMPLRMEYVASDTVGLHYDAWIVLALVQIVPGIARFVSAHFWGRLFDSTNFIALRIALNMLFAFNMLLFFVPHVWVQVLASICFGLGEGGGEIAWNLWVTKFSPPERTAEYMSVHVFLTGLRGMVAPMVVYGMLAPLGVRPITLICFGMILVACLMLLPLLPMGRRMQEAQNVLGGNKDL